MEINPINLPKLRNDAHFPRIAAAFFAAILCLTSALHAQSYTGLAYAPLSVPGSDEASLHSVVTNHYGAMVSASGYSLSLTPGTTYEIKVSFPGGCYNASFVLLTGGSFRGGPSDVIDPGQSGATCAALYGVNLTGYYKASESSARIFLYASPYMGSGSDELMDLNYTLEINEINATSYTDLTYKPLEVLAEGTLQSDILVFGSVNSADGYEIALDVGKTYKITGTYTLPSSGEDDVMPSGSLYILTGGDLQGFEGDSKGSDGDALKAVDFYSSAFADYYTATESPVRILLTGQFNFEYTLKVEEAEVTDYKDLTYSSLELGYQASGQLQNDVMNPNGNVASGIGYQIILDEGKTYRITPSVNTVSTCDEKSEEPCFSSSFNTGYYFLTETYEIKNSFYGTHIHEASESGPVYILLTARASEPVDFNYALKVELVETTNYADLTYSSFNLDDPKEGQLLSDVIGPGGNLVSGKGYEITLTPGNTYKISVEYSSQDYYYISISAGFYILDGNEDREYDNGGYMPLTIKTDYEAASSNPVRIFLYDNYGRDLNYTLTVNEINIVDYKDLTYAELVEGKASGKLQSDVIGHNGNNISAAGHKFVVDAGNTYRIAVTYKGSYVCAGFRLLDFIYEYYQSCNYSSDDEFTVSHIYNATQNGPVSILLYNDNEDELEYALSVEEIISYTKLVYAPVTDNSATGTLDKAVLNLSGGNVLAAGHKFEAKAGKTYRFSVVYESQNYTCGGFDLLKSLQGDYDDIIDWDLSGGGCGGNGKAFTASNASLYSPSTDTDVYILLYSTDGELEYTLNIEEITSYATLAYSEKLELNESVLGTLSIATTTPSRYGGGSSARIISAQDYSFQATAGKKYKLSAKFEVASQPIREEVYAGIYLLRENLQGNYDDVLGVFEERGYDYDGNYLPEFTATVYYTPNATSWVKVLLFDSEGNNFSYTLTLEEIDDVFYNELDYDIVIPTDGTIVPGEIDASTDKYIYVSYLLTGKDFSFEAKEGKGYKFTVTFESEQDFVFDGEDKQMGLLILESGELSGNYQNDIVRAIGGRATGNSLRVTGSLRAPATEYLKLLLYSFAQSDYEYSIKIEETDLLDYTQAELYQNIGLDEEKTGELKPIVDPSIAYCISSPHCSYDGSHEPGITLGEGFVFQGAPSKSYKVTATFEPDKEDYLYAGFYILRENEEGGFDFIDQYSKSGNHSELEVPGNFNGKAHILLFGTGDFQPEYSYSIIIEEDGESTPDMFTVTIGEIANGNVEIYTYPYGIQVYSGMQLPAGTTLILEATPADATYVFVKWWDNNTEAVRHFKLDASTTISATFAEINSSSSGGSDGSSSSGGGDGSSSSNGSGDGSSSSEETQSSSSSNDGTSSSSSNEDTPSSSSSDGNTPIQNRANPIIGVIGVQTIYYNLKGEPLGTIKPTTPGVYIEKQGKQTKRIVVR
ncbi:MAG: hypothetical protein FWH22_07755 [Fibromonadales bacterium]|nr:hypothetical protein [Fibromonadales bacterium]